MKVSLITPVDIKHSYSATEVQVYDYAKMLIENGIEASILVPKYKGLEFPSRTDYKLIKNHYKNVTQKGIKGRKIILPFKFTLYVYSDLTSDSTIYFAYSIYDHLINIIKKPKGQKYIIGAHSMHLKNGHILEGHNIIERFFNFLIKSFVFSNKEIAKNVYHHVINKAEKKYLLKLGIREENIFYVPTFVKTKDYHLSKNQSSKLKILHMGGANKGAGIVLQIIDKAIKTNKLDLFEFYFVGQKMPGELYQYAKKYKNIHIEKGIKENKKADLLSRMDVMIVPSVETFSRSMLEGLASGLYICASNKNPAALEIKTMGAKIYVIRNNNTYKYLEVLAKMINEKRLIEKFESGRRINREIVVRKFDEKVVLPQMLDMFIKVGKS